MNGKKLADETGSGTLQSVSLIAISLILFLSCLGSIRIYLAWQNLQAVADISALHGASELQFDFDGCSAADSVARLNHAYVSSCEIMDSDTTVTLKSESIPFISVKSRAGKGDGCKVC